MVKKLFKFDNKTNYYSFIPFLVLSVIYLSYAFASIDYPYSYDARHYWALSGRFLDPDGNFALLNYNNGFRGYLFPLIILIIRQFADFINVTQHTVIICISSLGMAGLVSYILPMVFERICGKKVAIKPILLVGLVIFYFWRGFLLYPLTDFPAITFLLLAYLLYPVKFNTSRVTSTTTRSVCSGIFLAATLIIRPAYQATIVFLTIFLLFKIATGKKLFIQSQWKQLLLLIGGMTVILFPQYLINSTHFNKHTPLVSSQGLFFKQLTWGMEMQRYETFVGDKNDYPSASVRFIDSKGKQIFDKEKQNLKKDSQYQWYLGLMVKYPAYFTSMYFTHFLNGLDIVYPTPYVKNLFKRSFLFSYINYSLWFFLIVFFIETKFFTRHKEKALLIFLIIPPSLLAIPGAVETRFFLPLFLVLYVTVFFGISIQYMKEHARRLISNYLIFYVIAVVLWFKLSTTIFSTLEHGKIYINSI